MTTLEKTSELEMGSAQERPCILFTAFEPSGDALAAMVIHELRLHVPQLKVYALGGPLMERAGANLLAQTAHDSAMGIGSLRKIASIRREIKRIKAWADENKVLGHVAVDSPAANFPIAKVFKRRDVPVIHLVAPQLWAWGKWRLNKLRRLTNLVLCVLPFEEQWFNDRDVPAKFIGHPAINHRIDPDELREHMHGMPQGAPRVAIFPGSRAHEASANIRLQVTAYSELQARHAGLGGVIVAANQRVARIVRRKIRVFPTGLHLVTGQREAAIAWCDLALVVSGTITLFITRQRKPMIGVYRTDPLSWLLAKLLVRTPLRLLPNVIADREIVPEFVPYLGGAMPIVRIATRILQDSKKAANQSEELNRVCMRFANKKPAEEASRLIIKVLTDAVRSHR